MNAPGPNVVATTYTVLPDGAQLSDHEVESFSVTVTSRTDDTWVVLWAGKYLTADSTWTYDRSHTYDLPTALTLAKGVVNNLVVNGLNWVEVQVWKAIDDPAERAAYRRATSSTRYNTEA